jgi:hypothetical protein
MRTHRSLGLVAVMLVASSAIWLAAQRDESAAAIAIDPDDIAGVVTSARARRPASGSSPRRTTLPTKFRRIVVTDERGPLSASGPAAGATTTCGYAATASSIRRPCRRSGRAASSRSRRSWRRTRGPARNLSRQLLVLAGRAPDAGAVSRAPERRATASSPACVSQHHWINQIKTGCNVCHQMGNLGHARSRPALGTLRNRVRRVGPPHAGRSGRQGDDRGDQRARPPAALRCSPTGRTASRPARSRRPRRGRRGSSATSCSRCGSGAARPRSRTTSCRPTSATPRSTPTARSTAWTGDQRRLSDRSTRTRTRPKSCAFRCSIPIRASGQVAVDASAVALLGRRALLVRPGDHESCGDGQPGPRLDVVAIPVAGEPARVLHRSSVGGTRAAAAQASARCSTSTRARATFHQVDTCFDTHHVQFAADEDETLYGNGVFSGAIGWVRTRVLDETGDEAAAQGWCMPHFTSIWTAGSNRRRSYVFEHLDRQTLAGMRTSSTA